jgi:hypothetical protein
MITLEAIAKDPALVSTIPREQLLQLYAMAVTAQGVILPALLASPVQAEPAAGLLHARRGRGAPGREEVAPGRRGPSWRRPRGDGRPLSPHQPGGARAAH